MINLKLCFDLSILTLVNDFLSPSSSLRLTFDFAYRLQCISIDKATSDKRTDTYEQKSQILN